jgi:hypothetical protein
MWQISCHYDEDVLPAITQTGENTFGCKVNGKVWRPQGKAGTSSNFQPYLDPYGDSLFSIKVKKIIDSNLNSSINIGVYPIGGVGTFKINGNNGRVKYTDYTNSCEYDFIPQKNCQATVIITRYDIPNKIVSGTFEATLNSDCGETIHITEGRFDVKFF